MLVQIYIPDNFSKGYIPFLLFRNACERVLKKYTDMVEKIEFIYDIHDIYNHPDTVVIMNMYDINLSDGKDYIRQVIFQERHIKILLINTEHWELRGGKEIFDILSKRNIKNIGIIEYNIINYEILTEHYKNISVLFLPMLYDSYLETYFKQNVCDNTIPWHKKDIDVLFYGSLNQRRHDIFDKLRPNWHVHLVDSHHGATNEELCKLIQRSKVTINVLFYDFNIMFDYYRNSLLLANRNIVVIETPEKINMTHEYWLDGIENHILNAPYDEIASKVDETLRKSPEEINEILDRQYKWFSRVSVEDVLVPFFQQINDTGELPTK